MPFKHHQSRRHRIRRKRYRVTNWSEYEAGLRQRGSLTVWLDPAVTDAWTPPCRTSRGRPCRYSDLAIETMLRLRLLFHLPLRMAEGFLASLFGVLGVDLPVPDHTTLSRRSRDFARRSVRRPTPDGPLDIVLDSTGLKIFGRGHWNEHKYGYTRRRWKKLHLAFDLKDGTVCAHSLTDQETSDVPAGIGMVDHLAGPIGTILADTAYDTPGFWALRAEHQRAPPVIIVPPQPRSRVPEPCAVQTQRDRHLHGIAEQGRMGWQLQTGYGRRSRVETVIGRYKACFGATLRARSDEGQAGEVAVALRLLNELRLMAIPQIVPSS